MVPTGCVPSTPPLPPDPSTSVALEELKDGRELENNAYTPGLGYYHSASRAWYPYPFNWYSPGWGYYYAGGWHTRSYSRPFVVRSTPTVETYVRVRSYVQQTPASRSVQSNPGSSYSAPKAFAPITRGGFGSKALGSPSS